MFSAFNSRAGAYTASLLAPPSPRERWRLQFLRFLVENFSIYKSVQTCSASRFGSTGVSRQHLIICIEIFLLLYIEKECDHEPSVLHLKMKFIVTKYTRAVAVTSQRVSVCYYSPVDDRFPVFPSSLLALNKRSVWPYLVQDEERSRICNSKQC